MKIPLSTIKDILAELMHKDFELIMQHYSKAFLEGHKTELLLEWQLILFFKQTCATGYRLIEALKI